MRGFLRTFVIFFVLVLTTSCSLESPADQYVNDVAAIKRGKSIFIGTCMGYCHSFKPSRREAPDLFDCNWIHGGKDQDIFRTISEGVIDTKMASYGEKLPKGEEDIWKIVAFLKTERSSC